MMNPRLERSFFERPTLEVARDLLGKRLVILDPEHGRISGIIVETEAYIGSEDAACHARSGMTQRNRSMWGLPGTCYVYFAYGMHWMLNLVTERAGHPAAILIRAILADEGIKVIRERRVGQPEKHWTDGPGKLCQAMGIHGDHDGKDSCAAGAPIFVEQGASIHNSSVTLGPRVGLNHVAEPWKSMPWRFRVERDIFARVEGEGT